MKRQTLLLSIYGNVVALCGLLLLGTTHPAAAQYHLEDLILKGSNFVSGAHAFVGSTAVQTTLGSSTQFTANVPGSAIPAANLVKTGNFKITAKNPAPGGGGSNGVNFVVN